MARDSHLKQDEHTAPMASWPGCRLSARCGQVCMDPAGLVEAMESRVAAEFVGGLIDHVGLNLARGFGMQVATTRGRLS